MSERETDREATQTFLIRSTMVENCGQLLTPDLIDAIVDEIEKEMRTGSCSWAFKSTEAPDE